MIETKETRKPKIKIKPEYGVESQVIVHCEVLPRPYPFRIRAWKSLYLVDKESSCISSLLYVVGISMHPRWTMVPPFTYAHFTLVFQGLPKSCESFDFIEVIPEPGAWTVSGIERNHTDVYQIDLG
jgi:hypothetical protein